MTAAGRVALQRAEAAQQTLEDEMLGALDEEERSSLAHLLRKAIEGQSSTNASAHRELTSSKGLGPNPRSEINSSVA
jgi:ABC-type transport system involved in cytochrome c biogenesis ATPase subunit